MTPYRDAAEVPIDPASEPAPRAAGLVRLNGSRCTCSPPGWLWCWWHKVQLGDRWECEHGGSWVRWRELAEAAEWRAAGIIERGWELGTAHPMCDVLAIMGWSRTPIVGSHRSRWTPPRPPEPSTDPRTEHERK